jgi:hypothetical protein
MLKPVTILILSLINASALAAGPRDTVEAFHVALASGNTKAATELLSPEVLIYESGFVERSRAEYASHHLAGDIAFLKTANRKVLQEGQRTEGNTAIVWQETETTGSSKGKEIHLLGTETAVLEKKADNWTILHVHWSSRKAK